MPWMINYFKRSKFANIDLNRYSLESFLLTNNFDNINKMICDAICDKDAHIREHFANIIGEKNYIMQRIFFHHNYYVKRIIILLLV